MNQSCVRRIISGRRREIVIVALLSIGCCVSARAGDQPPVGDSVDELGDTNTIPFTGEVLPVFYVRNLLTSVDFYTNKLGFACDHYFDHINGGSVQEWTYPEPPIYAEMRAGDFKFALHQASKPDSLTIGGMRHYFSVADVREHHRHVRARGVEVGDIVEQPWMVMYRVRDPDGHVLYIFTRPPDWED